MSLLEKRHETVIPTSEDAELAAESSRLLSGLDQSESLEVVLDNGERIQLPKAVRSFLTYLLVEMSNGNAVTIMPVHAELTTQEAADHLNVSRPYLIKLLNAGVLNFHRVGTHRRIRLADLMSYKEKLVRKSDAVLDELAEQAQDLKLGYEVEN